MRIAAMLTVVMAAAGCGPGVEERLWDVLAVVVAAEFGDGYATDGALVGPGGPGYDAPFTLGPLTLELADGRRMAVPAGTPGGNSCVELIRPEDRDAVTGLADSGEAGIRRQLSLYGPCVIVGRLDGASALAGFEVLRATDEQLGVAGAAEVGRVVDVRADGMALTDRGLAFEVADDVALLDCWQGATTVAEALDEAAELEAHVGVASGELRLVVCLQNL